jgi:hypothetical protein
VDGFINECAAFPAGVNDDQVDAWSQGAKRLMTVVGKRPQQAPPQRDASERSRMSNLGSRTEGHDIAGPSVLATSGDCTTAPFRILADKS